MEKKRHTLKTLILKTPDKRIVFVSKLYPGTTHDYEMLKQEFSPQLDYFQETELQLDLGFLGAEKDYRAAKIRIPHKRKRVKKGLSNQLSPEQKAHNRQVSAERVDIEHSIGEMKRCRSIHQVIRIRDRDLLNQMVCVSAGLANFKNFKELIIK